MKKLVLCSSIFMFCNLLTLHSQVVKEDDLPEKDEGIVTALGITLERKSLGYSVQEIEGAQLVRAGDPNLMTSLAGKIAGLDVRPSSGMPGAPAQIHVRGARSLNSDNTPLYIIDGMPVHSQSDWTSNLNGAAFSNRALDFDPNDIESVTVLKGQAASALYGIKGSNGVIIVTTKSGRTSPPGGLMVTLNSNITVDNVSRLPDIQQSFAQGINGTLAGPSPFSWGPRIENLPADPVYGGDNNGHPGLFFDRYKGEWVEPRAFNNPGEFFSKAGHTFNNNLSISDNFEFGNYTVGIGNANQSGIIRETGMDRYTARISGDFKPAEKWIVGLRGNVAKTSVSKLPSGNDSWLYTVYGAPPSFDLQGTPSHQQGDLGELRQISYRAGVVGNNPNWLLDNNNYRESNQRFFGNAFVEFRPVENASIRYQLGTDRYTTDNDIYREAGTGWLPTDAAHYPTPDNPGNYAFISPAGGWKEKSDVTRKVVNSLLTASINHDFSDDFTGTLMVGNEIDRIMWEYNSKVENYDVNKGYYITSRNNMTGFLGNIGLDYGKMLFFNATGRKDFDASWNNNSFFTSSASLAFLFTGLNALAENNILPFGKIRISYANGLGRAFRSYGMDHPYGSLNIVLYETEPQNDRTFEFGIYLNFLNHLVIDYSYFNITSSDQILPIPVHPATGYKTLITNVGHMNSKGHEIILSMIPLRTQNFGWDFSINFTRIDNRVVELLDGFSRIDLGGYMTPNIRASAGDTYPSIYGIRFLRDEKGRILVNEDPGSPGYGMPMHVDYGKIGEVSPDFYVSFSNNIVLFTNFSIMAQVDWKQGGQMYSGNNRLMDYFGVTARTGDREKPFIYEGYKADGTPNNISRGGPDDPLAYQTLYYNVLSTIDESHIYETSFVKLRQLALTVNLPRRFIAPAGIKRASLSFITRNILLWTTFPNFDPEASQGQGNMQGAMDYMSLPQATSYGLGLNITF
jgi:TonB-linked SusC/RagA family outer membrane protein